MNELKLLASRMYTNIISVSKALWIEYSVNLRELISAHLGVRLLGQLLNLTLKNLNPFQKSKIHFKRVKKKKVKFTQKRDRTHSERAK